MSMELGAIFDGGVLLVSPLAFSQGIVTVSAIAQAMARRCPLVTAVWCITAVSRGVPPHSSIMDSSSSGLITSTRLRPLRLAA